MASLEWLPKVSSKIYLFCFDHFLNCFLFISGRNCEHNIDECLVNPCLNSGLCVDGINNFTCSCQPGYSGPTCQVRLPHFCLLFPFHTFLSTFLSYFLFFFTFPFSYFHLIPKCLLAQYSK